MENIKDYREAIKNAKKTAMRDGYDQLVIYDTIDETYCFMRSYGQELCEDEVLVGKVFFYWENQCPKVKYRKLLKA